LAVEGHKFSARASLTHELNIFPSLVVSLNRILSDNKLQTIEREAFSGLRSLKRLVLQNNGLKSLPVEALESIEGLTSL
jgi:Leucine-rich repeat (LRR) protein